MEMDLYSKLRDVSPLASKFEAGECDEGSVARMKVELGSGIIEI